jgi:hypothetical protein
MKYEVDSAHEVTCQDFQTPYTGCMYSIMQLTTPYVVSLEAAEHISASERIQAEVRFATALEEIYAGDVDKLMAAMLAAKNHQSAARMEPGS